MPQRDKTHDEQIERWAGYVRNNPDKWKSKLKPFIDAQIVMSRRFYKNLAKTEEGKLRIKELQAIKLASLTNNSS